MPSSRPASALAHAVLMPSFAGAVAPAWVTRAIGDGLAGICYFGHNIESPQQVARLSAQLHEAGPVLISIDEEGGIVTRLHADTGSPHVGAAVLGRGPTSGTHEVAALIAAEVRSAGIDINLAPVADVNSNPANPVIGVRSFGDDPAVVSEHVAAFVEALQAAGVAACAKHFPGHGDTVVDSHVGLPTVDATLTTLRSRELVPFRAAVAAGARCVMTAHAVFTAIDDQPATTSTAALDLLRDELGFDGVIVSDAVDMHAISRTVGFAEGVVRALMAGVDLVALGNPALGEGSGDGEHEFGTAVAAIVTAVEEGRLSVDQLERSAARLQALRQWRADQRGPLLTGDPVADDKAAQRALRVRGVVAVEDPLRIVDLRRRRNIASGHLSSQLADELCRRSPGSNAVSAFRAVPGEEGRADVADMTDIATRADLPAADVIITASLHDRQEEAALDQLLRDHPEAVVVCLGWSADDHDIPRARNAIFTFGDSLPSARAVADLICR